MLLSIIKKKSLKFEKEEEKKRLNIFSFLIKIMKEEISKRKFIYIKILLYILMGVYLSAKPLTVKADGIPVNIIDVVRQIRCTSPMQISRV